MPGESKHRVALTHSKSGAPTSGTKQCLAQHQVTEFESEIMNLWFAWLLLSCELLAFATTVTAGVGDGEHHSKARQPNEFAFMGIAV